MPSCGNPCRRTIQGRTREGASKEGEGCEIGVRGSCAAAGGEDRRLWQRLEPFEQRFWSMESEDVAGAWLGVEAVARSTRVGAGRRALAAAGTSRQPPPSGCLIVSRRAQSCVERAGGDEGDILPQRCGEGATDAAFGFPKLRIHNAATASPCPLSPSPSPTRVEGSRRRGERGLSIWADMGSSACKWLRICCLRI
ncbi:MAG: hypothetical protein AW10_01384 [Candidatus Accumulibacter appositus]|uniref:Uncharacterized protein n=1 Tax=Candidatus Accumulibacter appositus TaxID=1454003 RepID=A0A011P0B1_9PROT|nr:MAG: hypothetical protein AW10_01384 [Candidatus Accumulibacter appositus]